MGTHRCGPSDAGRVSFGRARSPGGHEEGLHAAKVKMVMPWLSLKKLKNPFMVATRTGAFWQPMAMSFSAKEDMTAVFRAWHV